MSARGGVEGVAAGSESAGRLRLALSFLVAGMLISSLALAASRPHRPANVNYALFCLGCHTSEGEGSPIGRIPVLKDAVGHFARLPEGRRYVVNVPGVVNSDLNPEDTAALLNWMIETYAGMSRPEPFAPFTAEEVRRWREETPDDVMALRAKARALLAEQGIKVDPYP
jgi:hypothetical protein